MQSTEDRLTALERLIAIQTRALTDQQLSLQTLMKDMAEVQHNETVVLGIVTSQNHDLVAMKSRLDAIDEKLARILALLEPKQP